MKQRVWGLFAKDDFPRRLGVEDGFHLDDVAKFFEPEAYNTKWPTSGGATRKKLWKPR